MAHTSLHEDTNPAEREAANLLVALFQRLELAEGRDGAFEVVGGSQLESDDAATAYDPISIQVQWLLAGAFDNLRTLRLVIQDSGLPIVGGYPLIRAALEGAALSLWLTSGGTKAKRVYRALHRVWNSQKLNHAFLNPMVEGRAEVLRQVRIRLDELLRGTKGIQKSLDRDHPHMSDIILEAGSRIPSRTLSPIDVWRACSGLSHGNASTALAILESRLMDVRDARSGTYFMTSSFRVTATFVLVVADLIEAALASRDSLNVGRAHQKSAGTPVQST